mgnify:CR=1 FL=1
MPDSAALVSHVDYDAMPTLGDIARYHARERPRAIATWFEEIGRAHV